MENLQNNVKSLSNNILDMKIQLERLFEIGNTVIKYNADQKAVIKKLTDSFMAEELKGDIEVLNTGVQDEVVIENIRNKILNKIQSIITRIKTLNTEHSEGVKNFIDQYVTKVQDVKNSINTDDLEHNAKVIITNPIINTYASKKLGSRLISELSIKQNPIKSLVKYLKDTKSIFNNKSLEKTIITFDNRNTLIKSEYDNYTKTKLYSAIGSITVSNINDKSDIEIKPVEGDKDSEVTEVVTEVKDIITALETVNIRKQMVVSNIDKNTELLTNVLEQVENAIKSILNSTITMEECDRDLTTYSYMLKNIVKTKESLGVDLWNISNLEYNTLVLLSNVTDKLVAITASVVLGDSHAKAN